jgi:hypothetical protein
MLVDRFIFLGREVCIPMIEGFVTISGIFNASSF